MRHLDYERCCDEFEAEAAKFAETARADQSLPVPTCPEWTLGQLVAHVGAAHRWAGAIVAERATKPVPHAEVPDRETPDGEAERAAWLRAGAARLTQAVRDAGPQTPVWTFVDDQRAGFWARRMLHETAIHRADVALAVGSEFHLDAHLATDGIAEWLGFLSSPAVAAARPETTDPLRGEGQTLHLHTTDDDLDEDGEWLLRRTPAGVQVEPGHVKADVAVRGPAADVFLLLMRRRSTSDPRIEIIGDESLIDHWLEHTAF